MIMLRREDEWLLAHRHQVMGESTPRLLYKWRDQLEPLDDGEWPPENGKEGELRLQVGWKPESTQPRNLQDMARRAPPKPPKHIGEGSSGGFGGGDGAISPKIHADADLTRIRL